MPARVRKHVSSQEITITHTLVRYSLIAIYRGAGGNLLFVAKKTPRWPSFFSFLLSSVFFITHREIWNRVGIDIRINLKIISSILPMEKNYRKKKFIIRMKFRISRWSNSPSFSHLIHPFSSNLGIVATKGRRGWERSESKRWRNGDIVLPERGKRDRRHRSAPAPCFGSVEAPASLPPLLLFSLFPPPSHNCSRRFRGSYLDSGYRLESQSLEKGAKGNVHRLPASVGVAFTRVHSPENSATTTTSATNK